MSHAKSLPFCCCGYWFLGSLGMLLSAAVLRLPVLLARWCVGILECAAFRRFGGVLPLAGGRGCRMPGLALETALGEPRGECGQVLSQGGRQIGIRRSHRHFHLAVPFRQAHLDSPINANDFEFHVANGSRLRRFGLSLESPMHPSARRVWPLRLPDAPATIRPSLVRLARVIGIVFPVGIAA